MTYWRRDGRSGCTQLIQPKTLTEQDDGKCYLVSKPVIIQLKSAPTTGYNWSFEDLSPTIVVKESYRQTGSPTNVGGSGYDLYRLTLTKKGIYDIHMHYMRAWEKEPVESFYVKLITL